MRRIRLPVLLALAGGRQLPIVPHLTSVSRQTEDYLASLRLLSEEIEQEQETWRLPNDTLMLRLRATRPGLIHI